jgi:hypothetical protein
MHPMLMPVSVEPFLPVYATAHESSVTKVNKKQKA